MKLLVKNLLPFLILVFAVMGCTEEARRQSKEQAEVAAREEKAEAARDAIADQLNKQFDSRPDCLFHFQALGDKGKTLSVRSCSPTQAIVKPELVLDAENRTKLKGLGFEEIEVDSWQSAFRSSIAAYRFNDDASLRFIAYK